MNCARLGIAVIQVDSVTWFLFCEVTYLVKLTICRMVVQTVIIKIFWSNVVEMPNNMSPNPQSTDVFSFDDLNCVLKTTNVRVRLLKHRII